MADWRRPLPLLVFLILAGAALVHGPIAQPASYHHFADQHVIAGIPHFADVLSNLGFAFVALWGGLQLAPIRRQNVPSNSWPGYRLFLISLLLTALGSSYYHLNPDNDRLVLDRLPIALLCAGLLAGVWSDTRQKDAKAPAAWLALAAAASVAWWYFTERAGAGDLRPYLLLQGLTITLIPLWQWIHGTPASERWSFGTALFLYVLAKWAEVNDHEIAETLGGFSGHTLKHLLATGAAALIVMSVVRRVRSSRPQRSATAERATRKNDPIR